MLARLIAAAAFGLSAAAPAAAVDMTIPLLADFEDPQFTTFYDAVTSQLRASLADGRLVAESDRAPGSGSIFTLTLGDGTHAVSADVTATFSGAEADVLQGPGILVRYSEDGDLSFYGLFLTHGGYEIVAWADGGIAQSIGGSLPDGTRPGDPVHLAARELADGGAEFFLDGQRIGSLSSSAITGTEVGLAVFGAGDFSFDNFGPSPTGDLGAVASTPLQPAAEPAGWYVEENGSPVGPLTRDDVIARLADGRSTPGTLAWHNGAPGWAAASTYPELESR